MNEVTFTLTPEDTLGANESRGRKGVPRPPNLISTLVTLTLFFSIFNWAFGPLIAAFLVLMPAIPIFFLWLVSRQLDAPWIQTAQDNAALWSEPVRVSLTPRGVLETDSVEERLTLWDAITEVELTDKFLSAKDKRGGVLLIPMRAFGSAAAANLFKIEMDNHRMRHAVGLAPATPVTAQTSPPVTTPTVPQEAPPQQVTAGWWRKPQ